MTRPGTTTEPTFAVLSRKTVNLSTPLTDHEKMDRGRALARVIEDHHAEETKQEAMKREMKFTLAGFEAERDRLSAIVSRGEELRSVEVEERANYETDTYSRVRLDTGEVLEERRLRDDERQTVMPGVEG